MVFSFQRCMVTAGIYLVAVVFASSVCGCTNEPAVVEIFYELPPENKLRAEQPESTKSGRDREGASIVQRQESFQEDLPIPHKGSGEHTSQAPFLLTPLPLSTPALTQTPLLTPTPSPTLKPTPTFTPAPTATPFPAPGDQPSQSSAADKNKAIQDEIERYEEAVRSIQDSVEATLHIQRSILRNLQEKKAQHPESAGELQAEIEGIQASIAASEQDMAARIETERQQHLNRLAILEKR